MKLISCLIVFALCAFDLKAQSTQSADSIQIFISQIDIYLSDINKNLTNLHIGHSATGRKIRMWGTFDNNSKIFRHKITFTDEGVKEERILVTHIGANSKLILLQIIVINDKIYYAKKMMYSSNYTQLTKEELIDEKIYSKVDYSRKPVKWFYIWSFGKK